MEGVLMATFVFIGAVLPDTTRLNSPAVTIHLRVGPDYPDTTAAIPMPTIA
jgi:hypothetical protein